MSAICSCRLPALVANSSAVERVMTSARNSFSSSPSKYCMDCCRSAKRLGATDVKVIARKTRKYFKASPWELEDAEEEGVDIIENLQPVHFIIENGILTGMEFDKFKSVETERGLQQEVIGREILPCDTVVLAIGQDNAFPFIERNIGLEFGKWDMPVVDKTTFMSTRPGVFFGGDAAFGPANIIWAVEHGHQAAISIHNYCQGIPLTERPSQGMFALVLFWTMTSTGGVNSTLPLT